MDDVQDEADKHDVRHRVSDAVDNSKGLLGDAKKRFGKGRKGKKDDDDEPENAIEEDSADEETGAEANGKRRSKRKGKKA